MIIAVHNKCGTTTILSWLKNVLNLKFEYEGWGLYDILLNNGLHYLSRKNYDINDRNQFNDFKTVIEQTAKMKINVFIMAGPYRYKQNPLNHFYRSVYFKTPFDINNTHGDDALMTKANIFIKKLLIIILILIL